MRRQSFGTNELVMLTSPTEASAVSYYLVYVHKRTTWSEAGAGQLEPPVALGEWRDRFVLIEEGWRFSRREGRRALQR